MAKLHFFIISIFLFNSIAFCLTDITSNSRRPTSILKSSDRSHPNKRVRFADPLCTFSPPENLDARNTAHTPNAASNISTVQPSIDHRNNDAVVRSTDHVTNSVHPKSCKCSTCLIKSLRSVPAVQPTEVNPTTDPNTRSDFIATKILAKGHTPPVVTSNKSDSVASNISTAATDTNTQAIVRPSTYHKHDDADTKKSDSITENISATITSAQAHTDTNGAPHILDNKTNQSSGVRKFNEMHATDFIQSTSKSVSVPEKNSATRISNVFLPALDNNKTDHPFSVDKNTIAIKSSEMNTSSIIQHASEPGSIAKTSSGTATNTQAHTSVVPPAPNISTEQSSTVHPTAIALQSNEINAKNSIQNTTKSASVIASNSKTDQSSAVHPSNVVTNSTEINAKNSNQDICFLCIPASDTALATATPIKTIVPPAPDKKTDQSVSTVHQSIVAIKPNESTQIDASNSDQPSTAHRAHVATVEPVTSTKIYDKKPDQPSMIHWAHNAAVEPDASSQIYDEKPEQPSITNRVHHAAVEAVISLSKETYDEKPDQPSMIHWAVNAAVEPDVSSQIYDEKPDQPSMIHWAVNAAVEPDVSSKIYDEKPEQPSITNRAYHAAVEPVISLSKKLYDKKADQSAEMETSNNTKIYDKNVYFDSQHIRATSINSNTSDPNSQYEELESTDEELDPDPKKKTKRKEFSFHLRIKRRNRRRRRLRRKRIPRIHYYPVIYHPRRRRRKRTYRGRFRRRW